MMIGPAPMMRTEWMSVRFGIVKTAQIEHGLEEKGKENLKPPSVKRRRTRNARPGLYQSPAKRPHQHRERGIRHQHYEIPDLRRAHDDQQEEKAEPAHQHVDLIAHADQVPHD